MEEFFKKIVDNGLFQRLIWTVIIIVLNILVYVVISKFLKNKEKKNTKVFSQKKNKTFLRMLRQVVGVVLTLFAILTILQIFGVNVSSMLAGVGIASIVVSFALQDALKDIIRGFEIISDGYYEIGDVIKYGDNMGQVLAVGLRTTRIQDYNTMNIVSIANRNIDQVEVVSDYIYIQVPLPHEVKLTAAENAMNDIVKAAKKLRGVTSAEYQGIDDVSTKAFNYQIAVMTDPTMKQQVRRSVLRLVVAGLAAHKIQVPYSEVMVLDKKDK